MGDVPELGLQAVGGVLARPGGAHRGIGLLDSGYGEELVLRAADEEHRLGTGNAGHVRIVHPAA